MLNRAVARRLFARWLPVVLWMGLIFYLSARPSTTYPPMPLWVQKSVHLTEYAVLALLLFRALGGGRSVLVAGAWAWGLAVGYGVTDEIHQAFISTRHGSVADVGLDALGAALGLWLLWARRRPGQENIPEEARLLHRNAAPPPKLQQRQEQRHHLRRPPGTAG